MTSKSGNTRHTDPDCHHVNPDCPGADKCEPHGEEGPVESKRSKKYGGISVNIPPQHRAPGSKGSTQ